MSYPDNVWLLMIQYREFYCILRRPIVPSFLCGRMYNHKVLLFSRTSWHRASQTPVSKFNMLVFQSHPNFVDISELIELVVRTESTDSAIVVNCQLGHGRSSLTS